LGIIFVHGVNTRRGAAYETGRLIAEKFLIRHLGNIKIGNKTNNIVHPPEFPYWGKEGCSFAWNMASLPRDEIQNLGGAVPVDLRPAIAQLFDCVPGELGGEPLCVLAKQKLSLAVDLLAELALQNSSQGSESTIADFVVRASAYAEEHPSPSWLERITSDSQFLATLQDQISANEATQSLGGLGDAFGVLAKARIKLKEAVVNMASRTLDRAGHFASTRLLAWAREPLNETLTRFFGDIFVYLDKRGNKQTTGDIPTIVLNAIQKVKASLAANEPLIIIGHSLGGVITFDLLSHFCPTLEVDLFVSVESQVALFEEMKLYKESDKSIRGPEQKAKTPLNIRRWINIYDEVDVFAYSADRVFDRVDMEARYDSQTYTVKAHGACFQQERFYRKLSDRIKELK
jgi:hypothetical protein